MDLIKTHDWSHCPHCGSDQISGDSVNIDGIYASQAVECLECDATWTEVYVALGRDNYDPGEGD